MVVQNQDTLCYFFYILPASNVDILKHNFNGSWIWKVNVVGWK